MNERSQQGALAADELATLRRDSDVLWKEVHRQLQSGVGVPSIALNRLHWHAAIAELEILREEHRKTTEADGLCSFDGKPCDLETVTDDYGADRDGNRGTLVRYQRCRKCGEQR